MAYYAGVFEGVLYQHSLSGRGDFAEHAFVGLDRFAPQGVFDKFGAQPAALLLPDFPRLRREEPLAGFCREPSVGRLLVHARAHGSAGQGSGADYAPVNFLAVCPRADVVRAPVKKFDDHLPLLPHSVDFVERVCQLAARMQREHGAGDCDRRKYCGSEDVNHWLFVFGFPFEEGYDVFEFGLVCGVGLNEVFVGV